MSPSLQIGKLMQRDVKLLVQGHKESNWQNKNVKPGCVAQVPMNLTIMLTMLPLNSYDYHLPSASADQLQVQRELSQEVRCLPLAPFMLLPGALGL